MSEKLKVRNVTPILQMFRSFLLGRKHVPERATLRYTPLVAARTQPQPILPPGSASKISANYYFTRDGRREQIKDEVIFENKSSQKQLGSGQKEIAVNKPKTPGKYWEWD